jgi:hypothetical protein
MGSILASTVIAQAAEIINDEANVLLSESQALGWLNDGQRAASLLDPTVYSVIRTMRLAEGTRQQIAGTELLSVVRNMGTDGVTPGNAIRLVDRGIKDEFNPSWHSDTPSIIATEYMFDDRLRANFYVYPPQPQVPGYAEVCECVPPPDIPTVNDPITITDNYAPALIEFIVFRFFSRDSEEASAAKATTHAQMFASLIGGKRQVDEANSPKQRDQLN